MAVTGVWLSDGPGAAGSAEYFNITTDRNGNAFVNAGRVNSYWNSSIGWTDPQCVGTSAYFWVTPIAGIEWVCPLTVLEASANASSHFVLPSTMPSTLTSYGNFSTSNGDPALILYRGTTQSPVSTVSASGVVRGSSATFPFPTQSSGVPLAEGFYGLVNTNAAPGGNFTWVDSSYLAVGGSTTLSSAFGVDAANTIVSGTTCNDIGNEWTCGDFGPNPIGSLVIFTQYFSNQVAYGSSTISTGTQPVAVKFYGTYTTTTQHNTKTTQITTYTAKPSNAIVVNSGSNSVTFVDLVNSVSLGNVAVGTQPMAVALNGNLAYVPNYGSGTLTEVNVSTRAVTRTATVGAGTQSVAIDPSGSYVWVGGANHLYKVSLSTFAVVANYPVNGSVTSMAASNAQNELVYTLVQNCCSSASAYVANEVSLSNMAPVGSHASASAAAYAPYTMNGTLPTAAVIPTASVVSAQFSNGMGASATPTGFIVYDLVSHQQIMVGTTPTPVRGIAADPNSRFAYFTLPDSNEYISVPLESVP